MDTQNQKHTIKVCNGSHCRCFGASRLMDTIKKTEFLKNKQKIDNLEVRYTDCMGYCSSGPNVAVDNEIIFMAELDTIQNEIQKELITPGTEKKEPVPTESPTIETIIADDFLGDLV